jgi:hypothetical protein
MRRAVTTLSILFFIIRYVPDASAHDQWDNGDPVPAWVKAQCCGPSDAHHLSEDQVHVTPAGYKLDGYSKIIKEDRLLPSPDGSWWVFYRNYADGTQSTVYCFFGPERGS